MTLEQLQFAFPELTAERAAVLLAIVQRAEREARLEGIRFGADVASNLLLSVVDTPLVSEV